METAEQVRAAALRSAQETADELRLTGLRRATFIEDYMLGFTTGGVNAVKSIQRTMQRIEEENPVHVGPAS